MNITNLNNKKNYFFNQDSDLYDVIKNSSLSLIVKVIGMVLGLLISIFLGRTLGPEKLGIINLSNYIVSLLIVFSILGTQQVIIKEMAISKKLNNYNNANNILFTSYIINGFVSIMVTILFIILTPWLCINIFDKPLLSIPLTIALIVLVPQVYSRIFAAGLIGEGKIWQSNLVNQSLSIVIVGLLLIVYSIFNIKIDIINTAIAYAIGRITVMVTTGIYWNKIHNIKNKKNIFVGRQLLNTSLPILIVLLSSFIINNSTGILLGIFEGSDQVGLFSVAWRISLMTSFFLQITNSVISPKIASMYYKKEMYSLRKLVKQVTTGLFFIGIISLLFFIIGGNWILSFWGKKFVDAYYILVVLSFGQLINIATGAVSVLLLMSGHEKIHRNISLIYVILSLVLNIILIKLYGAVGAAIAMSLVVMGINLTKAFYVKKKLGIMVIPFLY